MGIGVKNDSDLHPLSSKAESNCVKHDRKPNPNSSILMETKHLHTPYPQTGLTVKPLCSCTGFVHRWVFCRHRRLWPATPPLFQIPERAIPSPCPLPEGMASAILFCPMRQPPPRPTRMSGDAHPYPQQYSYVSGSIPARGPSCCGQYHNRSTTYKKNGID